MSEVAVDVCITRKTRDRHWYIEPVLVEVCRPIPIASLRVAESVRIIPANYQVRVIGAYCRRHPTLLIEDPLGRYSLDRVPIAAGSVCNGQDILHAIMQAAGVL